MARDGEIMSVEINEYEARRILMSQGVRNDLRKRAEKIARKGDQLVEEYAPSHGYVDKRFFEVGGPRNATTRAVATVYGIKTLSHKMQSSHDVLTKSIDAGR